MELLTDSSSSLIIEEQSICQIDGFAVEIQSKLGSFADVRYFQVLISSRNSEAQEEGKLGLLRVGAVDGGLQRELELRKILGEHKMISKLLTAIEIDSVELSSAASSPKTKLQNQELELDHVQTEDEVVKSDGGDGKTKDLTASPETEELASTTVEQTEDELLLAEEGEFLNIDRLTVEDTTENPEESTDTESNSEYLPEEIYPDIEVGFETSTPKLILLNYLPDSPQTLDTWLQQEHELEASLLLASQFCQFCRYIYQKQWCVVNILPKFIVMGKTIQFIDLTGAYPEETKLNSGLQGEYCAPELSLNSVIAETMSTYTVASILHQALYQKLPSRQDKLDNPAENLRADWQKIPSIYQILKISLNSIPEERFPLSQLVNLLVKTRKSLEIKEVNWSVASRSTVGLSTSRLQNEDSHGVIKSTASTSAALILGVVADGMGGMAQGEVASQTAVKTVLEAKLPKDITTAEQRNQWLLQSVQQANEAITKTVRDGGTTLSVVLAVGRELNIAHVGDSRIYLLRKGIICQLSEDHSLVAMLLASGQITYEESLEHPDRSTLIKSLGSKPQLSNGYVQDLSSFGGNLSLKLEPEDTLILCSDGVWDLILEPELAEIFSGETSLQAASDRTIDLVLQRGANDNATIVALKCHLSQPKF